MQSNQVQRGQPSTLFDGAIQEWRSSNQARAHIRFVVRSRLRLVATSDESTLFNDRNGNRSVLAPGIPLVPMAHLVLLGDLSGDVARAPLENRHRVDLFLRNSWTCRLRWPRGRDAEFAGQYLQSWPLSSVGLERLPQPILGFGSFWKLILAVCHEWAIKDVCHSLFQREPVVVGIGCQPVTKLSVNPDRESRTFYGPVLADLTFPVLKPSPIDGEGRCQTVHRQLSGHCPTRLVAAQLRGSYLGGARKVSLRHSSQLARVGDALANSFGGQSTKAQKIVAQSLFCATISTMYQSTYIKVL